LDPGEGATDFVAEITAGFEASGFLEIGFGFVGTTLAGGGQAAEVEDAWVEAPGADGAGEKVIRREEVAAVVGVNPLAVEFGEGSGRDRRGRGGRRDVNLFGGELRQ
jgi:hypothetical protein